ncbi:MAG TPA: hypothetical protein DEO65_17905 [Bacillus bacterium]|nr:hypothetical protein [Bacillus sp. (in: firmicutes)]
MTKIRPDHEAHHPSPSETRTLSQISKNHKDAASANVSGSLWRSFSKMHISNPRSWRISPHHRFLDVGMFFRFLHEIKGNSSLN